jgi:hypothetical protein
MPSTDLYRAHSTAKTSELVKTYREAMALAAGQIADQIATDVDVEGSTDGGRTWKVLGTTK